VFVQSSIETIFWMTVSGEAECSVKSLRIKVGVLRRI
jgi:hypothetical protein